MRIRDEIVRPRVHRLAAAYATVLLLVAVAGMQVYLAHARGLLTPAKGGGFGLFSTVDKLANRHIRVFLIRSDGQETLPAFVPPPPFVADAKAFPTENHLSAVANRVATLYGGTDVVAIRVEVWRRAFDAASMQAYRIAVGQFVLNEDSFGEPR